MSNDLAPLTLALNDWGRPATLRCLTVSPDPPHAEITTEYPVTVVPQTIRIDQFDGLANLQNQGQSFLMAETESPPQSSWSNCELIVDNLPHRVTSVAGSGAAGWLLLETQVLTPPAAA